MNVFVSDYCNQKISSIQIIDEIFCIIRFDNGKNIRIFDDNQQCCEERWMTCDDDFSQFIGAKPINLESLECPHVACGDDQMDKLFVRLVTDRGCFRLTMHNRHNGYYSGFRIQVEEVN